MIASINIHPSLLFDGHDENGPSLKVVTRLAYIIFYQIVRCKFKNLGYNNVKQVNFLQVLHRSIRKILARQRKGNWVVAVDGSKRFIKWFEVSELERRFDVSVQSETTLALMRL